MFSSIWVKAFQGQMVVWIFDEIEYSNIFQTRRFCLFHFVLSFDQFWEFANLKWIGEMWNVIVSPTNQKLYHKSLLFFFVILQLSGFYLELRGEESVLLRHHDPSSFNGIEKLSFWRGVALKKENYSLRGKNCKFCVRQRHN